MKKGILPLAVLLSTMAGACSKDGNGGGVTEENKNIPTEVGSGTSADKPKALWIDAHANFSRFSTKQSVTSYIEKIKSTGFNTIYLDVKPGIGYCLYDSDILPKLEKWGGEVVPRDWDYLGFWLEEAERLDIDVVASISTLGFGYTKERQGLVYDDAKWDGKTQVMMNGNRPDDLVDIRDVQDADAAVLNPCLPEVQSFVVSIVEEIAKKYPKLKGVSLDYCRWYGADYGFSDATIQAFEAYSGEQVKDKNDILTATGGIGPQYAKWIEFRSMTVTNLISAIMAKVKEANPEAELHLWASAHWPSRYGVGQNWASTDYIPDAASYYTSTYNKTGFAKQLDVFVLGAYAEAVWRSENPNSDWSVENFVLTYGDYIKGECAVYGSIASYNHQTSESISDAVYLCLKNTDGLMVFDISHVINFNQWNDIKAGIERTSGK